MTDLAEAEYREALAEYRKIDPRVAERFANETRRTLELMERFPAIGGPVFGVDDVSVRQLPIHSFPYNVVVDNLQDPLGCNRSQTQTATIFYATLETR